MTRLCIGCIACLVLVLTTSLAGTEDAPAIKQVQALQQMIQKTIKAAEPAIASILVSRSEMYQKYGFEYSPYEPGKLGDYDVTRLDKFLQNKGLPREKRDEIIRQLDLADADNVPESFGSGVLIDDKGLILTPYHVVLGATKILVRLPGGKSRYADIHAADPRSDLALLQVQDFNDKAKPIGLGLGEKLERGQFILALANPHAPGLADGLPAASFGIISNICRASAKHGAVKEGQKTIHHYGKLLQTDVRLPADSSGGALLALDGTLVGLTSAQGTLPGLEMAGSFAVPIDATVRQIVDILRKGEEVEYAFLGVSFSTAKKPARGVALSNVINGSPADVHGLRPGDVILAVNGQAIGGSDDMYLALFGLLAGTKAKIEVRKVGKKFDETVTVALTKSHVPGKTIASHSRRPFFRGFRVDYTSLSVQCKFTSYSYESIPAGVLVTDVQPNSPAATALLKPGEVITHVNSKAVESPDHFYEMVQALKGPAEFTLISLNGLPAPKITIN